MSNPTYVATIHPKCPACGHVHDDSSDWEDGEHTCRHCGIIFLMESYIERSFNTFQLVTCSVCKQMVKLRRDGFCATHYPRNELCPGSKQPGVPQEERK